MGSPSQLASEEQIEPQSFWHFWLWQWALPCVSQVNSLHVASPVEAVLQLQDCSIFIKIIDSM